MLGLDRLPKNVQDNISYVLVGVAVFALLFGFLIAPQIKSISQNKRELSVKKRELAEFERLLEAYKSLPHYERQTPLRHREHRQVNGHRWCWQRRIRCETT